MIPLFLLLLAMSEQQAPAIDCAAVRAAVAQYGEAKTTAWALAHGYSFKQIREARKCIER